jgi:hypothetical protein
MYVAALLPLKSARVFVRKVSSYSYPLHVLPQTQKKIKKKGGGGMFGFDIPEIYQRG